MKAKRVPKALWFLAALGLLGALAVSCFWRVPLSAEEPLETTAVIEPTAEPDLIGEAVAALTLEQKIGQMLISGFHGTELNQDLHRLVGEIEVGGIVFMGRNVVSYEQTVALINGIRSLGRADGIPLFCAVDEEGGRVSRLPAEMLKMPSAARVGQSRSPDLARSYGEMIGRQVSALGYNLVFAPVLDVNTNPHNTVIGDRAFGESAETVCQLGICAMQGIAQTGVIPVVKHFPGHGGTFEDSHFVLAVTADGHEQSEEHAILPFEGAIEAGADVVMVGHLLMPSFDDTNPASLSAALIDGLLRHRLGFEGVVVTDDLTMGAITANYPLGHAAVMAVNAGVDLLLVCHGTQEPIEVFESIKDAVETGVIPLSRIEQSVSRILKLKHDRAISNRITNSVDVLELNGAVSEFSDRLKE